MSEDAGEETSAETVLSLGRPPRPIAERQSLAALKGRLFGEPAQPIKLNRYVLLERVGSGGMGAVYSAYDPELDRKVAIKLLLARQAGDDDEEARVRLVREAQALARVAHPNIVPVYDVGTYDEKELELQTHTETSARQRGVYVVMELVAGGTLSKWLTSGSHTWREVLEVFLQAGRGLACAHAEGLVHRDFKPANVVVGTDGRARVLDFGLARALADGSELGPLPEPASPDLPSPDPPSPDPPSPDSPGSLLLSPLTRSGTVMGTPRYMAPEQHEGADADPSADQFSFCAALYEGLYRTRPFLGDDAESIAASKRAGRLRKPENSPVPAWLFRVCARGMDPEPARRFPTMQALLEHIERAQRSRTVWVGAGVGAMGLSAALAMGIASAEPENHCAPGAERVAEVWNEQAKASVARPFESSQRPYAAASLAAVLGQMDQRATDWASMYDEACVATHVRKEQSSRLLDLRMACLNERLVELGALSEVLASADDQTLEHTAQAAQLLSDLGPCADTRLLDQRASAAEAHEDSDREDLGRRLAEVRVRLNAARYEEALSMTQTLLDEGEWPAAARAEIGLLHGRIERALGHSARAETILFDALVAARAADRAMLEFDLMLVLARVVWGLRVDLDEATRWLSLAQALADRSEPTLARQASLASARGSLAVRRGDGAAALPHLVDALSLAEQAHGPNSPAVASHAFELAELYRDRGEWSAAEEQLTRILELRSESLGDEHPAVAAVHEALGTLFVRRAEWKPALAAHERTLAIRERAFDPTHPTIASSLNNIASAKAGMGDKRGAADALGRALEMNVRRHGNDSPRVAPFHSNLGTMLADLGELPEAREHVERALRIVTKAFGDTHPNVAHASQNCAYVYRKMDEPELALESYETALRIWEAAEGPDHPMVLNALNAMSEVELAHAHPEKARASAERAVGILERREIAGVDAAASRFILARVLDGTREDPERALALARTAREGFAGSESARDELREVDEWLAAKTEGSGKTGAPAQ